MNKNHSRIIPFLLALLILSSCASVHENSGPAWIPTAPPSTEQPTESPTASSSPAPATSVPAAPPAAAGPGQRRLTKTEALADARQLVSVIEETHPAFPLKDIPSGYMEAKDSFLAAADAELSLSDFTWLVRAYLAALKDGHTAVYISDSELYLDVAWQAEGGRLFLLDDRGLETGREVTAIGDIPVERVFRTVDRYFAAENDAGTDQNDTIWSANRDVLAMSGVDCAAGHMALTLRDGDAITRRDAVLVKKSPYYYYDADFVIDSRMMGDVFYIDFNSCDPGTAVNKTISDLKNALDAGVTKVIVDVRDNPGGNSSACVELLKAMGMSVPQYGGYVRYSPLTERQYGKSSGYEEWTPDSGTAKPNPGLQLAVLTNGNTYSSATMLAVMTQDGKLGKIIGRPSANSPSAYGDVLSFRLNQSGLMIGVSFKLFIRPDGTADQKTLRPDIVVPPDLDILQCALSYLDKKQGKTALTTG